MIYQALKMVEDAADCIV